MTTLYRTPNLIIDEHEWHAAVRLKAGRVSLAYYWRPLSVQAFRWSTKATWPHKMPVRFSNRFWMYRLHIRTAMRSEVERTRAIAAGGGIRETVGPLRGCRALTILRAA